MLSMSCAGKVEGHANLFSATADRKLEPVTQYLSDLLEEGSFLFFV